MGRMKETFLDDRPYPATPGFKVEGTSKDAALATRGRAENLRLMVLGEIHKAGPSGLTPDEVATRLAESVLSVRPRVTELQKQNKIEKTGDRRKNASGLGATVWRVKR